MTGGGSQGTSPPLDLNCIALDAQAELDAGSCDGYAERILKLVTLLRETRAALRPLAMARYADQRSTEHGVVNGVDMLRAQAVLAQAVE